MQKQSLNDGLCIYAAKLRVFLQNNKYNYLFLIDFFILDEIIIVLCVRECK